MKSDVNFWTQFTFWVGVKQVPDCDDNELPSARRDVTVLEPMEITTKSHLTMKSFLSQPETFGALAGGQRLSIICADDVYYNLESLRLVFQNLGLL